MHVNSLFLLFMGLPFDRALPWHKALALSTVANAILHTISTYLSPLKFGPLSTLEDAEHVMSETGDTIHMVETGVLATTSSVRCMHQTWEHHSDDDDEFC